MRLLLLIDCTNCHGELGWWVCLYCGFAEVDHPITGILGTDCVGPEESERIWRVCGRCWK